MNARPSGCCGIGPSQPFDPRVALASGTNNQFGGPPRCANVRSFRLAPESEHFLFRGERLWQWYQRVSTRPSFVQTQVAPRHHAAFDDGPLSGTGRCGLW